MFIYTESEGNQMANMSNRTGSYNNSYGNRNNGSQGRQEQRKPYAPLTEEGYVARAEQVIESIKNKENGKLNLTTSQIRNILSMVNQIYNTVILTTEDTLSTDVQNQLQYLKVKLIYAAGRNNDVKEFVKESQLDQHLDHIGNQRSAFLLYSRYMEALVAYHRFLGGRD
jgi:CRISPR-associated protein Csm2